DTGPCPALLLQTRLSPGPAAVFAYGALGDQIGNLVSDIRWRIPTQVPRFFHGLERHWTFLGKTLGELGNFLVQFGTWNGFRDETDPLRILRRHHLAGQCIIESMLGSKMFG